MIFFYEILFAVVAVAAVFIGETWSRTWALAFLLAWLAVASAGLNGLRMRSASPSTPSPVQVPGMN